MSPWTVTQTDTGLTRSVVTGETGASSSRTCRSVPTSSRRVAPGFPHLCADRHRASGEREPDVERAPCRSARSRRRLPSKGPRRSWRRAIQASARWSPTSRCSSSVERTAAHTSSVAHRRDGNAGGGLGLTAPSTPRNYPIQRSSRSPAGLPTDEPRSRMAATTTTRMAASTLPLPLADAMRGVQGRNHRALAHGFHSAAAVNCHH